MIVRTRKKRPFLDGAVSVPDQPQGWRSGATLHYRTILCTTTGSCGPGHTDLSAAGRSIDPGPVLSGQAFCRTNCFLGPYGPAYSRTATKPYPGREPDNYSRESPRT